MPSGFWLPACVNLISTTGRSEEWRSLGQRERLSPLGKPENRWRCGGRVKHLFNRSLNASSVGWRRREARGHPVRPRGWRWVRGSWKRVPPLPPVPPWLESPGDYLEPRLQERCSQWPRRRPKGIVLSAFDGLSEAGSQTNGGVAERAAIAIKKGLTVNMCKKSKFLKEITSGKEALKPWPGHWREHEAPCFWKLGVSGALTGQTAYFFAGFL